MKWLRALLSVALLSGSVVGCRARPTEAPAPAPAPAEAVAEEPGEAPVEVAPSGTDTLVIGTLGPLGDLDPASSWEFPEWEVFHNTMGTLLTYLPGTTELRPGLAEGYEVSDGGLTYTLALREGLHFPDGTPFTAETVVWSIERTMRLGGDASWLVTDFVDRVEAVDDYTVAFTLQEPTGAFPDLLATPTYAPVSPDCYAEDEIDPASTCGGIGPYQIESWDGEAELVLQANAGYYGEPPLVARVVVRMYSDPTALARALEAGDVDVAWDRRNPSAYEGFRGDSGYRVFEGPSSFIRYLCFNTTTPPFDDPLVRQAVSFGVDRMFIAERVFGGSHEPLLSMVPAGIRSHVDVFEGYDPQRVADLLEGAGYDTGSPLEIELWWAPDHYGATEEALAAALEETLEGTGAFQVDLRPVQWAEYVDRLGSGEMPVFLLGWTPEYPVPHNFVAPFAGCEASGDLGIFYCDQDMEALLHEARTTGDEAGREQLYRLIQQRWTEEVPTVPLTHRTLVAVARSDVSGVVLDPTMLLHYSLISREVEEAAPAPAPSPEPTAVQVVAGMEKLDPLLVDLLTLLDDPAREGAEEALDMMRELVVLPADAGLSRDFYVDVLIGVREAALSANDLRMLAGGRLELDDVRVCSGEEGPPVYEGVAVYTGQVLVEPGAPENQALLGLAMDPEVLAIDPSFINESSLDVSVPNSWVNTPGGLAWTGIDAASPWSWGIDGRGVVVGIVDGGMDWDHEGFTNPGAPQTSRLVSQWDQGVNAFTGRPALDANLAAGVLCATGDNHGTHVAGIAAGDATAGGGRFPGVAPAADIVDVPTTFSDRDVILGVAYVFLEAARVGAPAVANLSLGSHFGPHDGTRLFEVALAGLTGPGCLIVAAAGNEGADWIHTDNDAAPIPAGGAGTIEVNVAQGARYADIRIWFDAANNYSAGVTSPAPGNLPRLPLVVPAAPPGGRSVGLWVGGAGIVMPPSFVWVEVTNRTVNPITGDRMIRVRLEAPVGELPQGVWTIELGRPGLAGGAGYYDAWVARDIPSGAAEFVAPTFKELISEPGNSPLIITTGSFDSKVWFEEGRQLCDQGRRSPFSSVGPTRETPVSPPGWLKPDISAPGCGIESAENTPGNVASPYRIDAGTSMAAPHVTGCAALMLQVNPGLTPAQVLALLPAFVRPPDAFFAGVPDNAWGLGKLDCGGGILSLLTALFGPTSGSLSHEPEDGYIEEHAARVDVADFIAEATFHNPYSPDEGPWTYGFVFRSSGRDRRHLVRVESDGEWAHWLRLAGGWTRIDGGSVGNLETEAEAGNHLQLAAIGDRAEFYVNRVLVASLDVSELTDAGDVSVATGTAGGDEIAGEVTRFDDFTVWTWPVQ